MSEILPYRNSRYCRKCEMTQIGHWRIFGMLPDDCCGEFIPDNNLDYIEYLYKKNQCNQNPMHHVSVVIHMGFIFSHIKRIPAQKKTYKILAQADGYTVRANNLLLITQSTWHGNMFPTSKAELESLCTCGHTKRKHLFNVWPDIDPFFGKCSGIFSNDPAYRFCLCNSFQLDKLKYMEQKYNELG